MGAALYPMLGTPTWRYEPYLLPERRTVFLSVDDDAGVIFYILIREGEFRVATVLRTFPYFTHSETYTIHPKSMKVSCVVWITFLYPRRMKDSNSFPLNQLHDS